MYNEFFHVWKKEKTNEELQSLKSNFFSEAIIYTQKQDEERENITQNTLRGKLLESEKEKIKKIISEIVEIRFRKILKSLGELPSCLEYLNKEEKLIYNDLIEHLQIFYNFKKELIEGRIFYKSSEKNKNVEPKTLLRFIMSVPAVIGTDMRAYGPFSEEDIASIPISNAKALISREAAIKMKITNRYEHNKFA